MAGSGVAHLGAPADAVLRVEHLVVQYPHGLGEKVHAVSDVSLDVRRGETLGIVGESGCGKSSLARAIVQLVRPASGGVFLGGENLTELRGARLRTARLRVQMVFQDPISSLNPRRRVRDIVGEGVRVAATATRRSGRAATTDRAAKVDEVLDAVGLDPEASATGARASSPVGSASASRSPGPS